MSDIFRFHQYQETTENIQVSVTPQFLPEESSIINKLYTFSYLINIENLRSETIQLVSRHWLIYENQTLTDEVKGEGVVGEQPIIEPRGVYEYRSYVQIGSVYGQMQGSYQFLRPNKSMIEAKIPIFDLVYLDKNFIH